MNVTSAPNILHMPFNFSVAGVAGAPNIAYVDSWCQRGDFLVRELATFNNAGYAGYDIYRIQLQTFTKNETLWSDAISMGTFQSTVETPWVFPTPWLIPKNEIVRCTLFNMTGTFTATGSPTTVTTEHCLIGEIIPPGSWHSNKVPYGFSMYFNLGFLEDFTSGGNVDQTNNLYPSFRQGLPPLLWDFELTCIMLDALNVTRGDICSVANLHKIQIFDRTKNKDFFNTGVVDGNVCGERVEQVLDAAALADPTGFPVNNVMQYVLPEPVIFKRGTQLTARLAFNLLFAGNQSTLSDLNQPANLLLMGNKLNG